MYFAIYVFQILRTIKDIHVIIVLINIVINPSSNLAIAKSYNLLENIPSENISSTNIYGKCNNINWNIQKKKFKQ